MKHWPQCTLIKWTILGSHATNWHHSAKFWASIESVIKRLFSKKYGKRYKPKVQRSRPTNLLHQVQVNHLEAAHPLMMRTLSLLE